jgi:hypothetical protein
LLYVGHTGVSVDDGASVFGFHPDTTGLAFGVAFARLKGGAALPGVVRDDTSIFSTARIKGLSVFSTDVILPEPRFTTFIGRLDRERQTSEYAYGFPNGDGDCNCVTWLERLGLPLLTGRIDEFVALRRIAPGPTRRFGECL